MRNRQEANLLLSALPYPGVDFTLRPAVRKQITPKYTYRTEGSIQANSYVVSQESSKIEYMRRGPAAKPLRPLLLRILNRVGGSNAH